MRYRRILAAFLILGTALAVVWSVTRNRRQPHAPVTSWPQGYRFGQVSVDTMRHLISFPAQVARDTGWVVTLVGLKGYPWVQEQAAITSPARLLDLQQAIAAIDWAFWDSLWTGRSPRRPLEVRLGATSPEQVVVQPESGKAISVQDAVFLGSPEFDPIALQSGDAADCQRCPAFAREQQVVTEALRGPSGELGWRLKPASLPGPRQEITVTLRF